MLKTSLSIMGVVAGKPKLITKKAGGFFLGGFNLKFQPSKKNKPLFLPCLCFNEELAVYIVEKYKEGNWLMISKAAITNDTHPKAGFSAISIIIQDILDEAIEPGAFKQTEEDDGTGDEYIAY